MSSTTAPHTNLQTQSPLFSLAAELRTKIWEYALASDIGIEHNAVWVGGHRASRWDLHTEVETFEPHLRRSATAMLQTCRRIFKESEGLLYHVNMLVGNGYGLGSFLAAASPHRLSSVRAVTFSFDHTCVPMLQTLRLLPHLNTVHMIVSEDELAMWQSEWRFEEEVVEVLERLRGISDFRLFFQDVSRSGALHQLRPGLPEIDLSAGLTRLEPWWRGFDTEDDIAVDGNAARRNAKAAMRKMAQDISVVVKRPRPISAATA